jgi:hypothetical protein
MALVEAWSTKGKSGRAEKTFIPLKMSLENMWSAGMQQKSAL